MLLRSFNLRRWCAGIVLGFAWKSHRRGGPPQIDTDLRMLLRRMSVENPLWGAPRIHGELLKLGFEVAQSSVAKYRVRRRRPPGQGWRTFLHNHAPDIASMDLFVVPTIGFDLLYAFVIVRLDRRNLVWINVTSNPTAEWIARQITDAFPWDEAPKYLLWDRDRIYGNCVTRRLRAMGIRDKPVAPASPWQNGFAERLIGSIRRERVDHFVVLGEVHLRRILRAYAHYYNDVRTHRSLGKDAPAFRPVQRAGFIKSCAILGGLHHHYLAVVRSARFEIIARLLAICCSYQSSSFQSLDCVSDGQRSLAKSTRAFHSARQWSKTITSHAISRVRLRRTIAAEQSCTPTTVNGMWIAGAQHLFMDGPKIKRASTLSRCVLTLAVFVRRKGFCLE